MKLIAKLPKTTHAIGNGKTKVRMVKSLKRNLFLPAETKEATSKYNHTQLTAFQSM
jgi:hypothetical protein